MEVVLNTTDIESLIGSFYKNVDEIVFEPKEIKVTLKISGIKPINQIINTPTVAPIQQKVAPLDTLTREASEGVMASGGKKRLMSRV